MNSIFKKITTSLVSPIWSSVNAVARPVFSRNAFHFPVPVISIGNIVAGGVGKTEITIVIANYLLKSGKKVAISTRGYGSDWSDTGGFSNNFKDALTKKFPDEALVILKKAPGAFVVVGKNRSQVINKYFDDIKPDVILLEDGYQHFKIHRDLDILVHDFSVSEQYFRDLPSHFEKAKIRISFSNIPKFWNQLSWFQTKYIMKTNCPKKAIVFCGIGNPERFKKSLLENQIECVEMTSFKDHKNYSKDDLEQLIQKSIQLNLPLLTTYKDYVKCISLLDKDSLEKIIPIEIDVIFQNDPTLLWKTINETISISHS